MAFRESTSRRRIFAFLAMAPAALSVGQCDSKGVCTVKVRTLAKSPKTPQAFTSFRHYEQGGIKDGAWWRKELNSAQPECKKIDPQVRFHF